MSGLGPEPGDPLPGSVSAIAPGFPCAVFCGALSARSAWVARCLAIHAASRGTLPVPTAWVGLGSLLPISAFGWTCARAGGVTGWAVSQFLDEGAFPKNGYVVH